MRHSQKGASFFGWLAVIALLVFAMVIAMKLVPIYMDHFALRNIVTSVNEDPSLKIRSMRDLKEAIKVTASGNDAYTVVIKYEQRAPLLDTVDLLVHFDETHIIRPLK